MSSQRQSIGRGRSTLKRVLNEHDESQQRLQLRGEGGIRVRMHNGRLVLGMMSMAASTTRTAFGIQEINQKTGEVTVRGGLIFHGMQVIEVGEAIVTVSGGTYENPVYCALRYVYSPATATILTPTVGILPQPTQQAWQMPLWSAYKVNGRIVIKEELWSGIVILPSVFA